MRFTSRFHVVVYWGIPRKIKQRNVTTYSGKLTRYLKYFNGYRDYFINLEAFGNNRFFLL
jgi:hypothetical protein